jgi:hypothetical protein
MKVLLMDLDLLQQKRQRKHIFPNLALMKLSAYHRAKGDEVYLNFPLNRPDITYVSCVFTWNKKNISTVSDGAIVGGSGIDLNTELPPEVEHIMPDYSLYPDVDFSLGFTSRGCIRKCPWCIVPEKEGGIKPWSRIYEFWDRPHRKILLLDNNLLAAPNWRQTMEDLIAEGIEVDFNQGLDIRLVNEDSVFYLRRVKAKQLRFAFDDIGYEKAVRRGIELLLKNGISARKLSFYVLVGFNGDDTAIRRMKLLKSYDVDVYPMLYKNNQGKEPKLDAKWRETVFWHGARGNLRKFLRVAGRL